MDLKEYVKTEKNNLDRFQEYWKKMNKERPANFPLLDINESEWSEQFASWQQTE